MTFGHYSAVQLCFQRIHFRNMQRTVGTSCSLSLLRVGHKTYEPIVRNHVNED